MVTSFMSNKPRTVHHAPTYVVSLMQKCIAGGSSFNSHHIVMALHWRVLTSDEYFVIIWEKRVQQWGSPVEGL